MRKTTKALTILVLSLSGVIAVVYCLFGMRSYVKPKVNRVTNAQVISSNQDHNKPPPLIKTPEKHLKQLQFRLPRFYSNNVVQNDYLLFLKHKKSIIIRHIKDGKTIHGPRLDIRELHNCQLALILSTQIPPYIVSQKAIRSEKRIDCPGWASISGQITKAGTPINGKIRLSPLPATRQQLKLLISQLEQFTLNSKWNDAKLMNKLRNASESIIGEVLEQGRYQFSDLMVPATYSLTIDANRSLPRRMNVSFSYNVPKVKRNIELSADAPISGVFWGIENPIKKLNYRLWKFESEAAGDKLIPATNSHSRLENGEFYIGGNGHGRYLLTAAGFCEESKWPIYFAYEFEVPESGIDLGRLHCLDNYRSATVTDSNGHPLKNRTVKIYYYSPWAAAFDEYQAQTDSRGYMQCFVSKNIILNFVPQPNSSAEEFFPAAFLTSESPEDPQFKLRVVNRTKFELVFTSPETHDRFEIWDATDFRKIEHEKRRKPGNKLTIHCNARSADINNRSLWILQYDRDRRVTASRRITANSETLISPIVVDGIDLSISEPVRLVVTGVKKLWTMREFVAGDNDAPRLVAWPVSPKNRALSSFPISKLETTVILPKGFKLRVRIMNSNKTIEGKKFWEAEITTGTIVIPITPAN